MAVPQVVPNPLDFPGFPNDNYRRDFPFHSAVAGNLDAFRRSLSLARTFGADPIGNTMLHLAIYSRATESEIIAMANAICMNDSLRRECINAVNVKQKYPIHLAVERRLLEVVKILITNGASITVTDDNGDTALHIAVRLQQPKIILELVRADREGRLHRMRNFRSKTASDLVVGDSSDECRRALKGEGPVQASSAPVRSQSTSASQTSNASSPPSQQTPSSSPPPTSTSPPSTAPTPAPVKTRPRAREDLQRELFVQIENKELDRIRSILNQDPTLINMAYPGCKEHYPLHYACVHSNIRVVTLLLQEFNAEIERSHVDTGKNALHYAVSAAIVNAPRVGIVELLAARMHRFDYQDKGGATASSLIPAGENSEHIQRLRVALRIRAPGFIEPITIQYPDPAPLTMPPIASTRPICFGCRAEITTGKSLCYACGFRSLPCDLGGGSAPPESPIEGEAITPEKIKLEVRLGKGGYGVVMRGVWASNRGPIVVAVKFIEGEKSLAFEKDFKALRCDSRIHVPHPLYRKAVHPNVVIMYGTYSVVENFIPMNCIVMEYAEMKSLSHVLQSGEKLNFTAKKGLAIDIFSALTFIHKKNIIHRDIKSSNILIFTNAVGGLTAKLTDFGCASGVQTATSTMSNTTTLVGTWPYMAPELARSRGTPMSDMWAAGIVIYEVMTFNLTPWADSNPLSNVDVSEFLKQVANNDAMRPQFPDNCGTPANVKEFIRSFWRLQPDTRPTASKALQFFAELD